MRRSKKQRRLLNGRANKQLARRITAVVLCSNKYIRCHSARQKKAEFMPRVSCIFIQREDRATESSSRSSLLFENERKVPMAVSFSPKTATTGEGRGGSFELERALSRRWCALRGGRTARTPSGSGYTGPIEDLTSRSRATPDPTSPSRFSLSLFICASFIISHGPANASKLEPNTGNRQFLANRFN